jgi:hypothetical protein
MSKNFGQNCPSAPDDLIQQLAQLRLQEARSNLQSQNPLKRHHETSHAIPAHNITTHKSLISSPPHTLSMDSTTNNGYKNNQISPTSAPTASKNTKVDSLDQQDQMAGLLKQDGQRQ